jgi:hypothetical protein
VLTDTDDNRLGRGWATLGCVAQPLSLHAMHLTGPAIVHRLCFFLAYLHASAASIYIDLAVGRWKYIYDFEVLSSSPYYMLQETPQKYVSGVWLWDSMGMASRALKETRALSYVNRGATSPANFLADRGNLFLS